MDPNSLKILLDSQNQNFRSALDVIAEQFKSRIHSMETQISELVKSLEFSQAEASDLMGDVRTLRQSQKEKDNIIENLISRVHDLEERLNYQEDYSRRNNLRISGITETYRETWEQTATTVSALLCDKMELPPMKLERAHRVGPIGQSTSRTIVARFESYGDREAVIRNARKLKGTGIYINEDLCLASQEKVRNQLPLMKQARSEGKIAYFKHTRLVIKDRVNRPSMTIGNEPPVGNSPAAGASKASTAGAADKVGATGGAGAGSDDGTAHGTVGGAGGISAGSSDGAAGGASTVAGAVGDGVDSDIQLRSSRRDRKKK